MWGVIESWFEPVRPSQPYLRADYVLLLLILAVGTWIRFWHLDNVGLHGDEDIMGLAVRGLLELGSPILPSGMYYPRALAHTYLMAGSVWLFGDNEWALRLPSAIVGSLCGLLAFFLGKRFLEPKPNLAFVAVMTFLPAMIDISLTARMYVFYVASLMVFAIFIFRWERTGSAAPFVLACLAWLLAMHFQPLSVFAAPLFLFPGLANRSWKQLLAGTLAVISAGVIADVLTRLASRNYPEDAERLELVEETPLSPLGLVFQGHFRLAIAIAVAVALAVLLLGTIRNERWRSMLPATGLLALGAAACALLHYHIGAMTLLFGTILWVRAGAGMNSRLSIIVAAIGLIALIQFFLLQDTGEFPGRKIIGAFVGTPSIWPTLLFAGNSVAGAAMFIVAFGLAATRLAQDRSIPVHFLFFAIAVWAPLVAIGYFKWYPAPRYLIGALSFFLLSVVAGATYILRISRWIERLPARRVLVPAVCVTLVGAMINPTVAWQAARNDYRDHPDHRGAAEFVRGLKLEPADIVIAEDSISQTYYLGNVDYRLQDLAGAGNYSVLRDGSLYDQYTGAAVIGSQQELETVMDQNTGVDIYIISNAQVSDDLLRRNRGSGIAKVLESERMDIIYWGRDDMTTVWKVRR